MDAAPVIARGHNVAVFVPPVTEAALPALLAVIGRRTLVVAADADRAVALGSALEPGLPAPKSQLAVSGLARAERRLGAWPPDFLLVGAADGLALLKRSALQPAEFGALVIAWPEQLDADAVAALEALLAESDAQAQRILLAAEAGADLDRLIERYAFKAMTFGFPAAAGADAAPIGPARYVLARPSQYPETRRRILDALDPPSDEALVIASCPESRAAAERLAEAAGPDQPPIFMIEPHQLGWLRALFAPLSVLRLSTAVEALELRADAIRARLARTIEIEPLDRELFLVGPLLDRFDPAEVAAAALKLGGDQGAGVGPIPARPAAASPAPTDIPPSRWSRLWVGAGRRDNVRPGDLVGAIANEAKVPGDAIGEIDVRDLYCLVEVRAEYADRVARALTGITLRGRRLVARLDRGPGASRPPRRP